MDSLLDRNFIHLAGTTIRQQRPNFILRNLLQSLFVQIPFPHNQSKIFHLFSTAHKEQRSEFPFMIPWKKSFLLTLCFLLFASSFALAAGDDLTLRGIIISTHGGGRDWGRDEIVPTMRDIKQLGANWVAIHPYAGISADGTVSLRRSDTAEAPLYWTRPILEAHSLGLKISITPHLAYWRSGFQWAGDIEFKTEEEWTRFWTSYRQWILSLAKTCKDADAFVLGTELDKTLHYEHEWRDIIAEVRKVFKGPVTYGSNWSDYKRVPFWDALDVIGIQAYFPLSQKEKPNEKDLREGWKKQMAELRGFSTKHNRNIVFTELGYNQSYRAAAEPWDYNVDDEGARPLQEMCWRIAFEAIASEPCVVGSLLWKWFPLPRPFGHNFQLATQNIMPIIANAWKGTVPDIDFDQEAYDRWRQERRNRRQRSNQE
jgi:hypothetical protein